MKKICFDKLINSLDLGGIVSNALTQATLQRALRQRTEQQEVTKPSKRLSIGELAATACLLTWLAFILSIGAIWCFVQGKQRGDSWIALVLTSGSIVGFMAMFIAIVFVITQIARIAAEYIRRDQE